MTIAQERLAERIREILSSLLHTEVNDPALSEVTITEVRIDREFEHAKILVGGFGEEGEAQKNEILRGLRRANGFLRRELAKRVRLRRVPELHFQWDYGFANTEHVEQLLNKLDIPPAPPEDSVATPTTDTKED
jgi:ribosome-binding factor A